MKIGLTRIVAIAAIFVAAAAPCLGAPAAQQNPMQNVPDQFRGEWNQKLEDCGTGNNDSALTIGARHISFYESAGPILAVITMGRTSLAIIARLTSAEGPTTWDAPSRFELSRNQAVLTDKTQAGGDFVRYKCPTVR